MSYSTKKRTGKEQHKKRREGGNRKVPLVISRLCAERKTKSSKKNGKRKREKEVDSRSPKAKRNTTPHLTISPSLRHGSTKVEDPFGKRMGSKMRPTRGRPKEEITQQDIVVLHNY